VWVNLAENPPDPTVTRPIPYSDLIFGFGFDIVSNSVVVSSMSLDNQDVIVYTSVGAEDMKMQPLSVVRTPPDYSWSNDDATYDQALRQVVHGGGKQVLVVDPFLGKVVSVTNKSMSKTTHFGAVRYDSQNNRFLTIVNWVTRFNDTSSFTTFQLATFDFSTGMATPVSPKPFFSSGVGYAQEARIQAISPEADRVTVLLAISQGHYTDFTVLVVSLRKGELVKATTDFVRNVAPVRF